MSAAHPESIAGRLPAGRPFTRAQAQTVGLSPRALHRLTQEGVLRRMGPGVYVDAVAPDALDLRAEAMSLVVPESAVITDRAAAWLHGVDVLARGAHLFLPPVSIFQPPGRTRIRTRSNVGGERMLALEDIEVIELPDGTAIRLTSALRTALDLGRLLCRDEAIGALDGLLRLGAFEHDQLLADIERFHGYRGVIQLRALAPLADARAESPPESVLRLRWIDAGLPEPEPQVPIMGGAGQVFYRLDLGCREIRYAAEYDGEDYHSTPEQLAHDRSRREIIRQRHAWGIDVFRRSDLFGPQERTWAMLHRGFRQARGRQLRLSA